ncbi:MAG: tRNA (adenosine(37)-N6)-dimethylallyltransferase MiaA [Dehalococcoidia bacterium]|nr:tRNA (adenosine(37)-N6)-dimethylallyltransferase MiaA [Dehalococcoidia bacterium]
MTQPHRPPRPRVVAIVGPTASGKTGVAVAAARRLATAGRRVEVISADSRQVRRDMVIGTAAPTEEEQAAAPHHLVGVVAPDAPWAITDWLAGARAAIEDITKGGGLPLVVGGTGQYVWALLEAWDVPAVPPDFALRARHEAFAAAEGREALHARLAAVDPASADRIDARNVRRVVRALEIVEVTGRPVPPLEPRDPGFDWRVVGLHWPREALHERADRRVEAMFSDGPGGGLLEETRALVDRHGRDFEALRSIGYREALGVLDGTLTLAQAVERTQIETHRLIRMQATWFREGDPRIQWVSGTDVAAAVDAVVTATAGS